MSERGSVVIVGYGTGIGHAVAAAFAERGHPVALIARDAERLSAAVERFANQGRAVHAFAADASDLVALRRALAEARERLGEAHVLVYNAALWRAGPVLGTDARTFEDDLRVDITAALVAAQTVAPAMVRRGSGTIVFTGGGLALSPSPSAPSLSVGKAGVRALALMLAAEVAPAGVRVGTVTIAGTVADGTPFAPAAIAQSFLRLHDTPPDPETAEIVFRGESASIFSGEAADPSQASQPSRAVTMA